jgi:hypothetical protein
MWRTHSCVPCRHSCRHAGVVDARRDESRRGTQECVRHGSAMYIYSCAIHKSPISEVRSRIARPRTENV